MVGVGVVVVGGVCAVVVGSGVGVVGVTVVIGVLVCWAKAEMSSRP